MGANAFPSGIQTENLIGTGHSPEWQQLWQRSGEELPSFVTDPDPEIYLSDNYAVLDLETNGHDKGDARNRKNSIVCGVVYKRTTNSYVSTFSTVDLLSAISDTLESCDFIVAQGAKFELKWFIRCGLDISRIIVYDTLLGDYVLAGNRSWALDLNAVAARHGAPFKENVVSRMIKMGIDPADIPPSWLIKYCKQDVDTTHIAMLHQRKQLHEAGLLPVFYTRCFSTPPIADFEMQGMFLDSAMVRKLDTETRLEYAEVAMRLGEITSGINMASPQQVADFMYNKLGLPIPKDYMRRERRGKPNKMFPLGQPATDDKAIHYLLDKGANKAQRTFLELKSTESKLRKKITAYLDRFTEACQTDCMLYGTINQAVSDTHRLTSSNPNLQNIDRTLKKVVTSRHPNAKIMTADYAQLEFMGAGELAKDKQALLDVNSGHDAHSFTASILYDLDYEYIVANKKGATAEVRQDSKEHTFKPLYGGTSGTKKEQAYYKAFRERYPGITAMQQGWLDTAMETGKLTTITGLIMYYPGTRYNDKGTYVHNTSKIFNHSVQQFATADLAPTGVALLWHRIKSLKLKSFLMNEVHDSAIGEVFDDEQDVVKELAKYCMTKEIAGYFKKVFNYDLTFPYKVDIDFNTHWGYDG